MKDLEGRWLRRELAVEASPATLSLSEPESSPRTVPSIKPVRVQDPIDLRRRIRSTAFAFRGFDVENLGRSVEFLDHPRYGPTVRRILEEASSLCSEAIHTRVNLSEFIRSGTKSTLETFPMDVAIIVAMELAQVALLEEQFQVPVHDARLSFGYSIGELAALVFGGVFTLEQLLPIPLGLAPDCADLAHDLTMGVLFSRGPALAMGEVEKLCRRISSEGRGLIGPSAFLSPNTALILGQGSTIDRLDDLKGEIRTPKTDKVLLRRNSNRWPPLHSPLVWQRSIPNRTALALYRTGGGSSRPTPTILSCVTGEASYETGNARELLTDWTDHPQRLWDVIDRSLAMGTEVVIHVGPRPNLIPSTYTRLSNNVNRLLRNPALRVLGRGVASGLRRHAWLARLLPSRTSLFRAPFVSHVILEDWLLEQSPSSLSVRMSEAVPVVSVSGGQAISG